MDKKLSLAVLISGRGSNLQSIIDACASPAFPARVALVISNEPDVQGLERARAAGIRAETVPHKSYPSRREFETALQEVLQSEPIDLVCLAGFMRVLTPDFVSKWEGRMLNIHPSLLPAYPGLHIHERVLANHEKESGCTVHFVTPGLDEGPTLVQKRVPVLPDDSAETLAARVLTQEHLAYPEAIALIARGRVTYDKETVRIAAMAEPAPVSLPVSPPLAPAPVSKVTWPSAQETVPMIDSTPHDNQPDDQAVQAAFSMWKDFTKASTYVVVVISLVLLGLAALFL